MTDRGETTHAFKDYTDRESEMLTASREKDDKIHRRLGSTIMTLIAKMQKRHMQCSYHALMNYYCPAVEVEKPDLDVSLDSMEESLEITQNEISTISTSTSSDDAPASNEQDIIRHHTPQHKVFLVMIYLIAGCRVRSGSHQEYRSTRFVWKRA